MEAKREGLRGSYDVENAFAVPDEHIKIWWVGFRALTGDISG